MPNLVYFDHIEVHVSDVPAYATFLTRVFSGGRWKHIGDGGTAMFISPSGLRIEVKATSAGGTQPGRGFCLPCIRMEGARHHIEEVLGLEIERSADNPDGPVHFFRDPEGIEWHAKDYAHMDAYVDW